MIDFKVGDKVRVNPFHKNMEDEFPGVILGMEPFFGTELTVASMSYHNDSEVLYNVCRFVGCPYSFRDSWLETTTPVINLEVLYDHHSTV